MLNSTILLFSALPSVTILLASSPHCHGFVSRDISKSMIGDRGFTARLFQSSGDSIDKSQFERSPHLLAMEEALEATRKYGATSKEARVAWEIAEEIENSIFSPCSKRCDPLPRSAPTNESSKTNLSPLFTDKSKKMNAKKSNNHS